MVCKKKLKPLSWHIQGTRKCQKWKKEKENYGPPKIGGQKIVKKENLKTLGNW
jgi:hypothetical protein